MMLIMLIVTFLAAMSQEGLSHGKTVSKKLGERVVNCEVFMWLVIPAPAPANTLLEQEVVTW